MMSAKMFSLKRAVMFVAVSAACAGAMAADTLPSFTFNPTVVGGTAFTADNIVISDYAAVKLSGTNGTNFTESGLLAVQSFQLDGVSFTPTGLNSTYGLYFKFDGAGTTSGGNPTTTGTIGSFSSLAYTLYAYNGTATFSVTGDTPTTTASNPIILATGGLNSGVFSSSVTTAPQSPSFVSNASANLTFAPVLASFFTSPVPFYTLGVSSFTNTTSEISPSAAGFQNGFDITGGGGTLNFIKSPASVPEPGSIALLGLGLLGFAAARRKASKSNTI